MRGQAPTYEARRVLRVASLLVVLLGLCPIVAGAQVEPAEPANAEAALPSTPPDPTPSSGRGFTWGGSAIIPLLLGDVRYADADALVPFYSPGAGVLGRVGIELPYGLSLLALFSVDALAVEAQKAMIFYRGGLELRWTIDTGSAALPILGVGGDILFLSRDTAITTTGGLHANAGIAFAVAWWAQVEIGVEVGVMFPGAAFRDTVLSFTPSIGGSFFF